MQHRLIHLRRRRTREQTGSTLLEGTEELSLALEAGVTPFAVYHCPELMQDYGPEVVETARAAGALAALPPALGYRAQVSGRTGLHHGREH